MVDSNLPVRWLTFAGNSPIITLNAPLAFLMVHHRKIGKVSLLKKSGSHPLHSPLAAAMEALLTQHGSAAVLEWIDLDISEPCIFDKEMDALLSNYQLQGEQVVFDLSSSLPSFVPVVAARLKAIYANLVLFTLAAPDPDIGHTPLVLAPRQAIRTVSISGREMEQGTMPEVQQKILMQDRGSRSSQKQWSFPPKNLMLFLNSLIALGYDRNITLSVSILRNLMLCRLEFEPDHVEIKNLVEQDTYQALVSRLTRNHEKRVREQIPEYGQLTQLFYSSGIICPAGVSSLRDELEHARSHPIDKGGDVYHIALDTNLLRDRFFSTFLSRLDLSPHVDFILCETVREELMSRDGKMNKKLIKQMAPLLKQDVLMELFFNQNQLEDRLRYVGLLEFNRMKAQTGCREQDTPRATGSGTRNDRIILDAYSGFVSPGCKVVFLSRDQEAVRMMRGEEGVISLLIKHEHLPKESVCARWSDFLIWVYLLSVAYGRVEWGIGGTPVAWTDGVWAGKSVEQWEEDHLRLTLCKPENEEDVSDYQQLLENINFGLRCLNCYAGLP